MSIPRIVSHSQWVSVSTLMLTKCQGVVFEDAPSGIRSGLAAGCKTIGLVTSHSREQVESAQPNYVVDDMTRWVPIPSILSAVPTVRLAEFLSELSEIKSRS